MDFRRSDHRSFFGLGVWLVVESEGEKVLWLDTQVCLAHWVAIH